MSSTLGVVFTLMFLATTAPAQTQDATTTGEEKERRIRILVNGLYNPTSLDFGERSTFESFVEQGSTRRSYDGGKGFVFEGGVIVSVTKELGVMASFEVFDGDVDATFSEELPHPLYFNQPRSVSGDRTGLSYSEKAFHVDFVFTRALESVTIDLFAGPSFFATKAEVISTLDTRSQYPFDDIELAGTNTTDLDDNPIGFNAGGAVTFRLNEVLGVAFQARFARASASIARDGGGAMEFDAGGFRVGGGIRLAF